MTGDLAGLLRDDGSVVVPPRLAGEVLRLLNKALVAESRSTSLPVTPAAVALLRALYAAANQLPEPAAPGPACAESSATGTTTDPSSTVEMLTVDQASKVIGSSTRWVRRLAGCGRLRARRVGRTWLIDADDLDRYRHGRTAA